MITPSNTLIRSPQELDLFHPEQPNSPPSPIDDAVITTHAYDIPNAVIREQDRCDDRIKCLFRCVIL